MSDEMDKKCKCPFCNGELEDKEMPFCKTCHIRIEYCNRCGAAVPADAPVCPECGQS